MTRPTALVTGAAGRIGTALCRLLPAAGYAVVGVDHPQAPVGPAYVAAKHALTGTFRALDAELAPDGVGVSVVHPTFLDTPIGDRTVEDAHPHGSRTTTGGAISAEDVARVIVRVAVRRRRRGRAPARVHVGRTAHLADLVQRVAPTTAARLAARSLRA